MFCQCHPQTRYVSKCSSASPYTDLTGKASETGEKQEIVVSKDHAIGLRNQHHTIYHSIKQFLYLNKAGFSIVEWVLKPVGDVYIFERMAIVHFTYHVMRIITEIPRLVSVYAPHQALDV